MSSRCLYETSYRSLREALAGILLKPSWRGPCIKTLKILCRGACMKVLLGRSLGSSCLWDPLFTFISILRIPTTYVDRRYTNQRVYETATRMAYPLGNSTIKPFSTTLDERRAKLAAHILRSSDNDPMRQVTYKPGSADAVEVGKRRIGRPRQHWTFHSNQLIHNLISHTDYHAYDFQNENILAAARQRRI